MSSMIPNRIVWYIHILEKPFLTDRVYVPRVREGECERVRRFVARADSAASTVTTASAASAKRYITPGQSRNAIQRSKLRIYTELIG